MRKISNPFLQNIIAGCSPRISSGGPVDPGVQLAPDGSGYAGDGTKPTAPQLAGRPQSIAARDPLSGRYDDIDLDRYPIEYAYVPGCTIRRTVVLERESLAMSDIPQMRDEFARIRRDELLILHFVDVLGGIAKDLDDRGYDRLSLDDRRTLVAEIQRAGLDIRDPANVRRMLSKIIRYHAYRHPEIGGTHDIIVPLIACMGAKLINAELNNTVAQTCFYSIESVAGAKEFIVRCGGKPETDRDHHDVAAGFRVFTDLSPAQVDALAQAMYRAQVLFYEERPLFHRNDDMLPPLIIQQKGGVLELPEEFVKAPSRFIEGQENVQERGDLKKAREFICLSNIPYDITRLKRFELNGVPIISKRVDPMRVGLIEEEIEQANAFVEAARAAGFLNCRSVEYLGLVYDAGNFYILMRDEQAPSLWDSKDSEGWSAFDALKGALPEGVHRDFDYRNAIWKNGELAFLDFEGHATVVKTDDMPPDGKALAYARMSRVSTAAELRKLDLGKKIKGSLTYRRFRDVLLLPSRLEKGRGLPPIAVIGDVHGNATKLKQLLDSPAVRSAKRVVLMGDYFDRDRDGKAVFDRLKKLAKRPKGKHIFLLGNHELYFLLAMKGDKKNFYEWIGHGGLEFLDTIMDLSEFREVFVRTREQMTDALPIEILERLAQDEPEVMERLFQNVQGNALLQEIFQWLAKHGRLFHIDEYGKLHIHAGIKNDENLDIGYFDKLKAEGERFKELLTSDDPDSLEGALASAETFRRHLEMRELDWIKGFVGDNPDRVFENLSWFGLSGVVYGHTQGGDVRASYGRFFNVDLSMAVHYGGIGGLLEISRGGMHAHRYTGVDSSDLQSRTLIAMEAFSQATAEDAQALIQQFQDYFLRAAFQ